MRLSRCLSKRSCDYSIVRARNRATVALSEQGIVRLSRCLGKGSCDCCVVRVRDRATVAMSGQGIVRLTVDRMTSRTWPEQSEIALLSHNLSTALELNDNFNFSI